MINKKWNHLHNALFFSRDPTKEKNFSINLKIIPSSNSINDYSLSRSIHSPHHGLPLFLRLHSFSLSSIEQFNTRDFIWYAWTCRKKKMIIIVLHKLIRSIVSSESSINNSYRITMIKITERNTISYSIDFFSLVLLSSYSNSIVQIKHIQRERINNWLTRFFHWMFSGDFLVDSRLESRIDGWFPLESIGDSSSLVLINGFVRFIVGKGLRNNSELKRRLETNCSLPMLGLIDGNAEELFCS